MERLHSWGETGWSLAKFPFLEQKTDKVLFDQQLIAKVAGV